MLQAPEQRFPCSPGADHGGAGCPCSHRQAVPTTMQQTVVGQAVPAAMEQTMVEQIYCDSASAEGRRQQAPPQLFAADGAKVLPHHQYPN